MEILFSLKYGYETLDNPWKMILVVTYLIVGLVLIIKGGDWFVDAASWIAEKFGIPKLIIGATIVSMATTLPELLVSVFAAAEGAANPLLASSSVDMATGNAIGSVIANTGLIMSLSILFMPVSVDRKNFIVKPIILLFSIFSLFLFSLDGKLVVWEAVIMLIILVGFFADNVIEAKRQMKKEAAIAGSSDKNIIKGAELQEAQQISGKDNNMFSKASAADAEKKISNRKDVIRNIGLFLIGVVGIVAGAQLLVDNATVFAQQIGVPDKIIAITIVAIGTSLPELITTITAIIKKQSDLSVGNVIGANIIDMCLILSLCSFIYGNALPVYKSTLYLDLPFAFGIVAINTVPTLFTKKLQRWQGIVSLALYITYLTLSCTLTF